MKKRITGIILSLLLAFCLMQIMVTAQDEEPEPVLILEQSFGITEVFITDITHSSAIVSWTTDIEADSMINYGETVEFGMTVSDEEMTTEHSIIIEDLSPANDYYIEVVSCISSDNCIASDL